MHHQHQPETQQRQQPTSSQLQQHSAESHQQQPAEWAEEFEPGYESQQTGYQTGEQMSQEMSQQIGLQLQDVETPEQQVVVDDITRAIQVCEWCADQCIQLADPEMIECIRSCRDAAELGQQALVLIPRNSPYAETTLRTLEQAVRACGQECSHHPHGHCQECAHVLDGTARSIAEFLGTSSQQGGQMTQPIEPQQSGPQ